MTSAWRWWRLGGLLLGAVGVGILAGCGGALLSPWIAVGLILSSLLVSACADSHGRGGAGTSAGEGRAAGEAGSSGSGGSAGSGAVGGTAGQSGQGGVGGAGGTGGVGGTGGLACTDAIECVDFVPQTIEVCCEMDPNVSCNYWSDPVCADGSCRPMGEPCPEDCEASNGTLGRECVNNQWIDLCCPEGVECNYGQSAVACMDGSCVNAPETCGQCYPYQDCVENMLVEVIGCCPEGAVCNFGQAVQVCADGSCRIPPDLCPQ